MGAAPAVPTPAADDMDFLGGDNSGSGFAVAEPVAAPAPVAAVPEAPVSMLPPGGDDHLRKFQEQSRIALQARDAEADQSHQEVREKAQGHLQKLAKERSDKIEKRKSDNVQSEKEAKARNEALFSDGPVWDRVISLVDMKSDNEKQARKTQRMREILAHLQQQES